MDQHLEALLNRLATRIERLERFVDESRTLASTQAQLTSPEQMQAMRQLIALLESDSKH